MSSSASIAIPSMTAKKSSRLRPKRRIGSSSGFTRGGGLPA